MVWGCVCLPLIVLRKFLVSKISKMGNIRYSSFLVWLRAEITNEWLPPLDRVDAGHPGLNAVIYFSLLATGGIGSIKRERLHHGAKVDLGRRDDPKFISKCDELRDEQLLELYMATRCIPLFFLSVSWHKEKLGCIQEEINF